MSGSQNSIGHLCDKQTRCNFTLTSESCSQQQESVVITYECIESKWLVILSDFVTIHMLYNING